MLARFAVMGGFALFAVTLTSSQSIGTAAASSGQMLTGQNADWAPACASACRFENPLRSEAQSETPRALKLAQGVGLNQDDNGGGGAFGSGDPGTGPGREIGAVNNGADPVGGNTGGGMGGNMGEGQGGGDNQGGGETSQGGGQTGQGGDVANEGGATD